MSKRHYNSSHQAIGQTKLVKRIGSAKACLLRWWACLANALRNCRDIQRARHTFHEDVHYVAQDEAGGEEHQQREDEGADGVHYVVPRVVL